MLTFSFAGIVPACCSFVKKALPVLLLFSANLLSAQTDTSKNDRKPAILIRGYAQVRYNRLFETNPNLRCEQCDRSWGKGGGFSLRRVRVIFFGQINPRIYFYVQPDFATSAGAAGINFGQIRDAYFDFGLDKKNEYRLRFGQSKMPYGFENMQSSQNRLPLDRADALNSALLNERDMGLVFYWAPAKIRERFASLVADGLKGSGDYGVFGLGVYNGQAANKLELNDAPHVVARITYPFKIGSQIVEGSLQGYSGRYVLASDQLSTGVKVNSDRNYADRRAAVSAILYPKPFGIQAEYNIGEGPAFNKLTDSIEVSSLQGGYVLFSYQLRKFNQLFIPFARFQYYDGAKKHETDARRYKVNETELGLEWQQSKNFELVFMYVISSRRFEDYALQNNFQKGKLLRIQAQLNF